MEAERERLIAQHARHEELLRQDGVLEFLAGIFPSLTSADVGHVSGILDGMASRRKRGMEPTLMDGAAFTLAAQERGLAVDTLKLHPLYTKLPEELTVGEKQKQTPPRRLFLLACEPLTGLYTHGLCDIRGGYLGTKLEDYALLAPTDSIDLAIDQVIERTNYEPEAKPEAGSFNWA